MGCSCQILRCAALFFSPDCPHPTAKNALLNTKFAYVRSKSKIPTASYNPGQVIDSTSTTSPKNLSIMIALKAFAASWLLVAALLLESLPGSNITPPEIIIDAPDHFCADATLNCGGIATIDFSIESFCTTDPNIVEVNVLLDLNNDGLFIEPLSSAALEVNDLSYTAEFETIAGEHALIIEVVDACGEESEEQFSFMVGKDCTPPPVPACPEYLEVVLEMEDSWPYDGIASIGVEDLFGGILSDTDPCFSDTFIYSINLVGELPELYREEIEFSCHDYYCNNMPVVELHAWDESGNRSTCFTQLDIQQDDDTPPCNGGGGGATTASTYDTEIDVPFGGDIWYIVSNELGFLDTVESLFELQCLPEGEYDVMPFTPSTDYLNGVSTFDVVLISQHILGVQLLDSPYKMIAADVNGSSTISTLDLLTIRKLILGIIDEFPNDVPNWRFVRADYVFPDPMDPFEEGWPDSFTYPGSGIPQVDFVAVKMGDINLDAMP